MTFWGKVKLNIDRGIGIKFNISGQIITDIL
jgi:hypothetical protein